MNTTTNKQSDSVGNPMAVFMYVLRNDVKKAQSVREELAERIKESNGEALYAIRWLQNCVGHLQYAQYAEELLTKLDEVDAYSQRMKIVREYFGIIVAQHNAWRPERSSSAWANATNDELYDTRRALIDRLGDMIKTDLTLNA